MSTRLPLALGPASSFLAARTCSPSAATALRSAVGCTSRIRGHGPYRARGAPAHSLWITRGASQVRGMCSGDTGKGIIHSAKTAAANQLLRTFLSGGTGFDNQFANARITSVDNGGVDLELEVTKQMLNPYMTLHGGAIASLVDLVGTLAIITTHPTKPGVSVEMNVSFLSTAKEGQTLLVRGKALKIGKKLAFTTVELMCKESGQLIATGRHTKAV